VRPETGRAVRPVAAGPVHPALLAAGPLGGAIPRRRIGRALAVSLVIHAGGGAGLLLMWLLAVDPLPGPPIVVRFFALAPPPPREAPARPENPPSPPPILEEAPMPALHRPPPARMRPEPPPLKVEAADLPLHPLETDLPPLRHEAPSPPHAVRPVLAHLDGTAALPSGTGSLPELELLVPGARAHRGPGDGIAGRGDGLPVLSATSGAAAPGIAGRGRGRDGAPRAGGLESEPETGTNGLASFLGRKYGTVLVEAARLGQRTNDGSRYSLLVPMLSQAYRSIRFRGLWHAPGDAPVASVRVDAESVAIRYRDGTLHVIVPTRDGLVALYVSADPRAGSERSKVDEAERALQALRSFAGTRG
jgi:hypothetical protein